MRKIFLSFLLITSITGLFAQTVNDSAVLGAGYASDVYYSMKNGHMATSVGTNWHLAFSVRNTLPPNNVLRSVSILANEGRGVRIFEAPDSMDVSKWSTFDTAGYAIWGNPHNSDSTWDIGALNVSRVTTDPYHYGWGSYDISDHNVYGSKMYLVRITTGSGPSATNAFKKLTIESLIYDTQWVFTYANLDNTDSTHMTISKHQYSGKMFAYQNLVNDSTYDREPSAPWDLLFTRYGAFVTQMGQTIFSPTTGVLSYPTVMTSKVSGVPTATALEGTYVSNIANIGTDWKINPGPGQPVFVMKDSLAYFTKRADGQTDKLVFTGLTTSATGVVSFSRTNTFLGTGVKNADATGFVALYPNPATSSIIVQLNDSKTCTVNIYDITGKSRLNTTIKGLENTIDISTLHSGVYFVSIENNGSKKVTRLIVQ
jgi:hypothetical protein